MQFNRIYYSVGRNKVCIGNCLLVQYMNKCSLYHTYKALSIYVFILFPIYNSRANVIEIVRHGIYSYAVKCN